MESTGEICEGVGVYAGGFFARRSCVGYPRGGAILESEQGALRGWWMKRSVESDVDGLWAG